MYSISGSVDYKWLTTNNVSVFKLVTSLSIYTYTTIKMKEQFKNLIIIHYTIKVLKFSILTFTQIIIIRNKL